MKVKTALATQVDLARRHQRRADVLTHNPPQDPFEFRHNPIEAQSNREEAERLLKVPADEQLAGTPTTELVPRGPVGLPKTAERFVMIDTLQSDPNVINIDASEHRAALANRAGVLTPALDAVQTAGASNSLEKMLCHQLAAVHTAGMGFLIQAEEAPHTLPIVERVRLTNSAVRCFDVYQNGCLVYQKLKSGGQQKVLVQYQQVNVADGGQAIVAGRLKRGSPRRGRRVKKA